MIKAKKELRDLFTLKLRPVSSKRRVGALRKNVNVIGEIKHREGTILLTREIGNKPFKATITTKDFSFSVNVHSLRWFNKLIKDNNSDFNAVLFKLKSKILDF